MPKKISIVVEWDCKRDNPSCVLHGEGGSGCQNAIRRGNCPRPVPHEGVQSLYRIFDQRRLLAISANEGLELATGTN